MTPDLSQLRLALSRDHSLSLSVRVIPKSPRTEWAGVLADGSYKIKLRAVPERGKANEELIRFLATEFSVPRNQVEILSGQTHSHKQLRLTN